MNEPLRALLVEDVERDAELVVRELRRAGFDVTFERVETSERTAAALAERAWDVVISDYYLHSFDAPSALRLMQAKGLDLPFIIVSGMVGEEAAVDAMRAGAHDYFRKDRLGPKFSAAVRRELREARIRRERAETTAALKRSRAQIEQLVAHSNFVLYARSPVDDFAPTFVSANIEHVTGHMPAECVEPGWWIAGLHPDDRAEAVQRLSRVLETGHARQQYRFKNKSGDWRWLSDDLRVVRDEEGRPTALVGSWSDVTESRTLREQLMISDRMASIGTLAAGVAHEINNPLAALIANLDIAAQELALTEEEAPALPRHAEIAMPLRDARESAERIRLIVKDLRVFSRADEEKTGPIDVRRMLDSALGVASNETRHRARVVKDYGEHPPAHGNEARLVQVFVNLIVNAAQAIPEGRADENEIRIVTRRAANGRVVVEIRDTGVGIPEEVRTRIFDPFFTTKAVGEGTGLGLAICHRIVSAQGGEIQVESEERKGSVFRVILPAATTREVPRVSLRPASEAEAHGKILVVDDEKTLGRAVERILAAEHDVRALTSARQARDLIAAGERFDIILCDLTMPDMTGMELHAELLRIAPDQAERMVFMTGGSFTPSAREFLDTVERPRLEKPFDSAALRALVHGLLRGVRR